MSNISISSYERSFLKSSISLLSNSLKVSSKKGMRIASNSQSPLLHCHKIFFSISFKILPYNSYVERKSLVNLEYLSILEINGKGSFDLLQGQITADMEKVSPDNCVLGAICNIKGRVINSFIVALNPHKEDSYFLVTNNYVLERTKNVLDKYKPFYQCSIDICDDYSFYGITEGLLIKGFPETNLNESFQNYKSHFRFHYLEKKIHLIALKEMHDFEEYDISSDVEPWKIDEIKNLNFEINPQVSEKFTPHELGYHLTTRIDFEKGCYTGQEIVARMHYRAKKLPTLSVVSTKNKVRPLQEITDQRDKLMGIVLTSANAGDSTCCLLSLNKNFSDQKLVL